MAGRRAQRSQIRMGVELPSCHCEEKIRDSHEGGPPVRYTNRSEVKRIYGFADREFDVIYICP